MTPPNATSSATLPATPDARRLSPASRAILRTVLYYEIFGFPLTLEEISRLCGMAAPPREIDVEVSALVDAGLLRRRGDHHFVGDEAVVEERRRAEEEMRRVLPRARRRARLIARFPFVRAVAFSGTLAKGVMKPRDDVDFFVVTAPGRVWVCRLLLMGFKKLVLLNSHRWFCVNYLVGDDRLQIPDRNLFTATEIAWLKPVVGGGVWPRFHEANAWVAGLLPNWTPGHAWDVPAVPGWMGARAVEGALGGDLGNRLDAACRRLISWRNRVRYRHLHGADLSLRLRSDPGASKHHPDGWQERVLARHAEQIGRYEARHGVKLSGDRG